MKKLVLIMISTLIFTSCSRDESNDKKVDFKDFLIGEWESDSDPGYGDPTFFDDGKVSFHYYNEEWGDDFFETGVWVLKDRNLKITWKESDAGLEVYDTTIIKLTKSKLIWEVIIDGKSTEESYSKQ